MLWLVVLLPVLAAPAVWGGGRATSRRLLGSGAVAALTATLALAAWGAATRADATYRWGSGITLRLGVDDAASVGMVLVPAVALAVIAYAAAHEGGQGLRRMLAVLVAFVGAMELVVLADDLLTLLIGWELVGACSWALIGHRFWEADKPRSAAHAFITTRAADLGLFVAAGAVLAGVGSFDYTALTGLDGAWLHAFVAGVLVAAAGKSAQLPFSPWLSSAMAGPTSVSALLHAATMVAAGAFVLIRLHEPLAAAPWFGPAAIGVGLSTALAGGVVASLQTHAKRLLAASTSAQYGLMFVAVGAGFPAAALAHLVAHAVFKALLFLAAGVAESVAGTFDLRRMRIGRSLPWVGLASATGALALAGVPPLGGAWTKEAVVAAAGHEHAAVGAAVVAAGGLSAFYAFRFQTLAFGWVPRGGHRPPHAVSRAERWSVVLLGAAALAMAASWAPGSRGLVERLGGGMLAEGKLWEIALSLTVVMLAASLAVGTVRQGLQFSARSAPLRVAGDWLALPRLARIAVVDPVLGVARALGGFDVAVLDAPARYAARSARRVSARLADGDTRVVDAGVRGTAATARLLARIGATVTEPRVDAAGRDLGRRLGASAETLRGVHTGMAHHYYLVLALGTVALVAAVAFWR